MLQHHFNWEEPLKVQTPRVLRLGSLLCSVCLLLAAQGESSWKRLDHRGTPYLFQVSTLDALTLGLYQGIYSVGALKRQGDFGLGTFEGIDGEMTILNGHFYHFHSDGILTEEPERSRVPFAVITKFQPELRFATTGASMGELSQQIDKYLASTNLFYAIQIHGNFSELTTRAIPKLFPPYPPLSEAVAEEVKFPFRNIDGTLVAFRCPAWVKGINQVGYHYHFISDDQTVGGHALSFTTGPVVVEVQLLRQNSVWLPDEGPFLTAPLPVTQ
jgi:acetolactate decarboxylase